VKTLIFDLDDTLIPDSASALAAFRRTGEEAAQRFGVDAEKLGQAALVHAEELWRAAPTWDYCFRLGIAAWEGLTSDFPIAESTSDSDRRYLHEWAPDYRREAWQLALEDFGIHDDAAAQELAEHFRDLRFAGHVAYEDADDLLDALTARGHTLVLLTNGPEDLQRQKLAQTGLERHFVPERTFISGAMGLGKPNLDCFRHVLELLSVEPRDAVMIGDNPERDIKPAIAAGMHGVWARHRRHDALVPTATPRFDELRALAGLIADLEAARS